MTWAPAGRAAAIERFRAARSLVAVSALLVTLTVVAACVPARSSAAGVIVAVDASAPGEVSAFTLRTDAGEQLRFDVGALELDGGAFPAQHLQEHLVTGQPVAVAYEVDGAGALVAHRLVDAPWLQP